MPAIFDPDAHAALWRKHPQSPRVWICGDLPRGLPRHARRLDARLVVHEGVDGAEVGDGCDAVVRNVFGVVGVE